MSRDPRACPGACNHTYRTAWEAFDAALGQWQHLAALRAQGGSEAPERPAEPTTTPTFGDPIWCPRCRSVIARALSQLDDLASLLDSWADGHRGATSGEPISRSRTAAASPSPIGDTLDKLYGELVDVEDEWRERRGYSPRPRRARDSRARRLCLAFLGSEIGELLTRPEYEAFAKRILTWERLLFAMAHDEPVVRRRPGRCPRCRLVNVLQTRDDGYTECRGCGRLLDEEEYQRDVVGSAGRDVVAESQRERQAS